MTLAVAGSALVTFLVASLLLKTDKSEDEGDLVAATASMESMKGRKSIASSALAGGATSSAAPIEPIVFACDAGMGSSAMGASVLRKKIHSAGYTDVTVVNKAIADLEDDIDLVVTHQDLTARAEQRTPSAVHVSVDNFLRSTKSDEIVEMVRQNNNVTSEELERVVRGAVRGVDRARQLRQDARRGDHRGGAALVAAGAVDDYYVEAMHERETSVSTFMGNGLAIPHGTNEAKPSIRRTAISFVRYAEPIDWNGQPAEFVVGIAGAGDDHLSVLSSLAGIFTDDDAIARLRAAGAPGDVLAALDEVSA